MRALRLLRNWMMLAPLCAALAGAPARAAVYEWPDAELLDAQFTAESWGSGLLVGRTDLPGPGVRLQLTLGAAADKGKTVIGDEWSVAPAAGLAWDGGYLPNDPAGPHAQPHANVSLGDWARLALRVAYVSGASNITVKLFLNTGMTGPSGYPSNDTRNDTSWLSRGAVLKPGEACTLVLDFARAQAVNAADNPWPHSGSGAGWTNRSWQAINERDRREITNMGLEVYGAAGTPVVLDLNRAPAPPRLAIARQTTSYRPALTLLAADARDYRIEYSVDLRQWNLLATVPSVTGAVTVVDNVGRPPARRFYRAVSNP